MDPLVVIMMNRTLSQSELEGWADINEMVPLEDLEEEEKPAGCGLLDQLDRVIEFIMLKQDAGGQARSKSLCRTMRDISKDPLYRSQRDRLAPHIEPVHGIVYLPQMIRDGHPKAWDAERRTWHQLPSLAFLPRGSVMDVARPNSTSCSAPGLLFFQHQPNVPAPTSESDGGDRVEEEVPAPRKWNSLCVCNPLTQEAVFVRLPPSWVGRAIDDADGPGPLPAPVAERSFHILLHTGSGPGFTLYDLNLAPFSLLKLHVEREAGLTVWMRPPRRLAAAAAGWCLRGRASWRPLPSGGRYRLTHRSRTDVYTTRT